jgi:ribonuclease BN (tRNA processing enzyme)
MRLTFVGSGDAFGSGGRLQTCLHLTGAGRDVDRAVLVDCGTSSLIGMRRFALDPNRVDVVLLSHLHGDHFGGVPFFVLHGQFNRRTRPLIVAGPPGVRDRVEAAMEIFFPGSTKVARRFIVEFVELAERVACRVGGVRVTPYLADHASGAPSFVLRVEYAGRIVTYSGDTAWTDALVEATRDADVFVCESYLFDRQVKYHLDYRTLERERARLTCRRVLLTHMSEDMLARAADAAFPCAEDGLVIEV